MNRSHVDLVPHTDSARSLGTTDLRWLKLWTDEITCTGNINIISPVANDADSAILSVNRIAPEGSNYLNLYINDDQTAYIDSNWDISIRSNLAGGVIELGAISTNIVSLIGATNRIGEPSGTENLPLRHYGYITNGANQRYVTWDVQDGDDYFHLARSAVNILGFKIEMPVDLGDNALTTTGTLGAGATTVTSLTAAALGGDTERIVIASTAGLLTSYPEILWNSTSRQMLVTQGTSYVPVELAGTVLACRGEDGQDVRINTSSYGAGALGAYANLHSRGTAASPGPVQSGDRIFSIEGWGRGATANSAAPRAGLGGFATETWTDTEQGADLRFGTTPTGGVVTAVQWRILNNGNLVSNPDGTGVKNILTAGTLGAGAITGTSLTDGTATLDNGELLDLLTIEATTTLGLEIGDTQQLVLTDGKLAPTTTNDIDIGDSTHLLKDVWQLGKYYFRDSAIYAWSSGDGWLNLVADTGVEFNTPIVNVTGITFASGGGFDCGDAGGFSGIKFNAGTTELEVWIDGSKIGHFSTDGSYTDDV